MAPRAAAKPSVATQVSVLINFIENPAGWRKESSECLTGVTASLSLSVGPQNCSYAAVAVLIPAFWQTDWIVGRSRVTLRTGASPGWRKMADEKSATSDLTAGLTLSLTTEQRERIGAYWWRRAEGELTSWVGFGHVLEDLRAEGSPISVIALAERSVEDERRHALFCREWAARFGHDGGELSSAEREATGVPGRHRTRKSFASNCSLLSHGDRGLFHLAASAAGAPRSRAQKAEPPSHEGRARSQPGRLGHLSTLDPRQKDWLRSFLPVLFEVLPAACYEGPEEPREELVPYGYFTPRLLRSAHDEALREVILPGLAHLDIPRAA